MLDSLKRVESVEYTVVYHGGGEFPTWPFNGGIWKTDDGVVVVFINHDCDYSASENLHDVKIVRYGNIVFPTKNKQNQLSHACIETYGAIRAMRTIDDGDTRMDDRVTSDNVETFEQVLYNETPDIEPHDFSNRDTLMVCWLPPHSAASDTVPWVKLSDGGRSSWSDAKHLPMFDSERIQSRPSYIAREDGTLLLMLTGKMRSDPRDVPIVYTSFDGGQNWTFLLQIDGSERYRMLCLSPVLLGDGTLVAAVRCKISVDCEWTEIYRSTDDGRNWSLASRVNDLGAPSKFLEYDGSLVCIYGYRHPPYGIHARVSHDDGATWSREWIPRDDGANYDLGYPWAVVLDGGTILATYHFNEQDDDVAADGGPRHIMATRFDPTELLIER